MKKLAWLGNQASVCYIYRVTTWIYRHKPRFSTNHNIRFCICLNKLKLGRLLQFSGSKNLSRYRGFWFEGINWYFLLLLIIFLNNNTSNACKKRWLQKFLHTVWRSRALLFTYNVSRLTRLANTLSGKVVIAIEDKTILQQTLTTVWRE